MIHTAKNLQAEMFWCGIPNNGDFKFHETRITCLKCLEVALTKAQIDLCDDKNDIIKVYNKLKKREDFNNDIKELLK